MLLNECSGDNIRERIELIQQQFDLFVAKRTLNPQNRTTLLQ